MFNEDNQKLSYKKVVSDSQNVVIKDKELVFTDYENIRLPIYSEVNKNRSSSAQYLSDIFQEMAQITSYVKDHYGFHGVGNELTVYQVLDCIEKSTFIEIVSDIDSEHVSEDDDILV